MRKNGFTLIELVGVIVVLSLIIVLVATKGFGAFNSTKDKIAQENLKAIKEAADFFMTEVKNCDDLLDKEMIKDFTGDETKKCKDLIEQAKDEENGCLEISLEYLLNYEYVTNSGVKKIYDEHEDYKVKGCLDANDEIKIEAPDL